jgi:hypothetical protein
VTILFHCLKLKHSTNDKNFFEEVSNPILTTSSINLVLREMSLVRDRYIVKQINKYWQEGKNIFIVYGASHAVMQEPAIRYMLEII